MKDLMSPADLAAYLDVPLSSVYNWRVRGGGPEGVRLGKHVRYRRSVVEAWIDNAPSTLRERAAV